MPSSRTRRARLAALAAATLTLTGVQLFSTPGAQAAPNVTVQILGANDFHGRIANDPTTASAGAAVMAGAVKSLRTSNPNTVFAMAGDIIGATTFDSFIDKDKPTIDAMNSAGLDVSSVGNHEFDQGYDDLKNRVMAPFNASTNPKGGANWQYLAANVRLKSNNTQPIAPTWIKDFGTVQVGFIGAVTEHLPELVSPAGISSINVTNIVTEANASADALKTAGADVIVLLVHEGSSGTTCGGDMTNPASDFGKIVTGVNDKIDAIVSGHTHLEYNCHFPVAGWAGRPVTERPVVSSGQYGFALNQLQFTVDSANGQVQAVTQSVLKMKTGTSGSTFNYTEDPPTKAIVDAAVANGLVLGAQPAGKISGPLYRGKLADGTTENRGQESTLSNLVAEVQQDATEDPATGGAQIAFMNPGGLRQDLLGVGAGSPRDVTYRQAADVQPFGNTLVNMKLTGAQLKTVLEQQWQPTGAARPFLRLGVSKGFTYTYDPGAPTGSHIGPMWLNGVPINPATTYSVTVNSFLASGGDNFLELNNGTQKKDAGQVDLQAFVNYMSRFSATPLQVDASQRAVGVHFPTGAPATYKPGTHVKFDVSSWAMTGPGDVKDTAVEVKAGSTSLGSFALDNTAVATTDEAGKTSVDVVVPNTAGPFVLNLTLTGANTGTTTTVPIQVVQAKSTVAASLKTAKPRVGKKVVLRVNVTGENGVPANGQATAIIKGGTAITVNVVNGVAEINLGKFAKKGMKSVEVQYLGSPALDQSTTTITFKVKKAKKNK